MFERADVRLGSVKGQAAFHARVDERDRTTYRTAEFFDRTRSWPRRCRWWDVICDHELKQTSSVDLLKCDVCDMPAHQLATW